MLDEARYVLCGGMESMSQTPYAIRGIRGTPLKFGPGVMLEDVLFQSLRHPLIDMFMAQTAEKLARKYDITRQECDEFAYLSQMRAKKAIERGLFEEEKVEVEIVDRKGRKIVVKDDDHLRPDTTLEGLSKLRPAFSKDGLVTAGNASGIVDGACAVVITSEQEAERANLEPIGRLVSWGIVGVDPTIMGIGPAPAIRLALKKAGLRFEDIDLFEINEAFAPQYLAVERELSLPREKTNINGGAIALGHPLGATGAILTLKVLLELRRQKKKYGISSMCIGGGQGIALIVEAL
jgi:acetyl-CoA acetyltransferase family protein